MSVPQIPAILTNYDVPTLAREFVSAMETEQTSKWCKCLWAFHPDDTKFAATLGKDVCRVCTLPKTNSLHDKRIADDGYVDHPFQGVRMRRVDTNAECPVHTKEGFLIKFVEWMAAQ